MWAGSPASRPPASPPTGDGRRGRGAGTLHGPPGRFGPQPPSRSLTTESSGRLSSEPVDDSNQSREQAGTPLSLSQPTADRGTGAFSISADARIPLPQLSPAPAVRGAACQGQLPGLQSHLGVTPGGEWFLAASGGGPGC